jgi:DNA-binding response OmpR family regulator
LTRDQLLEATGAPGRPVNDRSIDTLISRVRRKLGDTRARVRMIETCHGHGYRFSCDVE